MYLHVVECISVHLCAEKCLGVYYVEKCIELGMRIVCALTVYRFVYNIYIQHSNECTMYAVAVNEKQINF